MEFLDWAKEFAVVLGYAIFLIARRHETNYVPLIQDIIELEKRYSTPRSEKASQLLDLKP